MRYAKCDVCDTEDKDPSDWMRLEIPTMPMDDGETVYDICSWSCLGQLVTAADDTFKTDVEEDEKPPVPPAPQPIEYVEQMVENLKVDGQPVQALPRVRVKR